MGHVSLAKTESPCRALSLDRVGGPLMVLVEEVLYEVDQEEVESLECAVKQQENYNHPDGLIKASHNKPFRFGGGVSLYAMFFLREKLKPQMGL